MNLLVDELRRLPRLDGAACAGMTDVFDVPTPAGIEALWRAQHRALAVCASCPVLDRCRAATVPDPDADVLAQGDLRMFDVAKEGRRRAKARRLKREREQRVLAVEAEAIRAEAREIHARLLAEQPESVRGRV